MCSKMKNYYKRKAGKDMGPQDYRYGEVAYAHSSPFLGVMMPGKSIQVVENNLYRAPIYEHKIPHSDFLVIRTRLVHHISNLCVALFQTMHAKSTSFYHTVFKIIKWALIIILYFY